MKKVTAIQKKSRNNKKMPWS